MDISSTDSFSISSTGQTVAVGSWLPMVVLIILFGVIVWLGLRGMQKNANRSSARQPQITLNDRNEQLKQNLAEIQARNQAELDQTRAILREAQASSDQIVNETREGVVRATREETERGKTEIRKAREEHLGELRREANGLGQDEPPPAGPNPK